ncbi:MAG: CZB domain-containing protein [Deferribacterota bacterium]|nr:CZB domain-containing protein [Deferribacterota bacterium]
MDLSKELSQALGKHSIWKNKIKRAITTGQLDTIMDIVVDYHECDFGKWLCSNEVTKKFSGNKFYEEIKIYHKKIHEEAKEIVELAKKDREKALKMFNESTLLLQFANIVRRLAA